MKNQKLNGYIVFTVLNYMIVGLAALACFLPLLNVFAISLSSNAAAATGKVIFWPLDFSLASYEYCMENSEFIKSFFISVIRVLMGCTVNLFMCVLCAYPLSKSSKKFKARTFYAWIFVFTTLFSGGLIPTYMIVKNTNLLNNIFALIIPSAVPVFYIILMLNFFRNLPDALEESAFIDGAGHWTILWKIYFPLSAASIATISLFAMVDHWNSWFDAMIYMTDASKYPLASYLQVQVVRSSINKIAEIKDLQTLKKLMLISDQTTKAAMVFIGAVPILCVYPFLQRYFTTGIVMGSVKG